MCRYLARCFLWLWVRIVADMVRGVELHWLSHPDAQVQGNEAKLQTPTQLTSRPPAHEASMYVNTSQTAHSMDAAFSCEKRLCSLMDHMCAISRHPQALLTTKPFWTDDPKKGYRRLSILRKPPLPSLMKQAGKTLKKIQKKKAKPLLQPNCVLGMSE